MSMRNTVWQWKQHSTDLTICWPSRNNHHRQLQKLHFVRWIEEKFSVFVRKRLVFSVGLFPSSLPIVHNLSSAHYDILVRSVVFVGHTVNVFGFQTSLRSLTRSTFHRAAESKLHPVHYVLESSMESVKVKFSNWIRKCFSKLYAL